MAPVFFPIIVRYSSTPTVVHSSKERSMYWPSIISRAE